MSELNKKTKAKRELVWSNIAILSVMHMVAIYIFYLRIFYGLKFNWYHLFLQMSINLGITAGYHRLWSHKAYKANSVLQVLLIIIATTTYQNSCYDWVRDHRVHHKFSETDADPHNSKKGFFFSHIGWLFVRKHPEVIEKGKDIDMSDLKANPIIMFQHKYYYPLVILFAFIIPTYIWYNISDHSLFLSFLITLYHVVISLHVTWGVNSFAHFSGLKPYNRNIGPTDNLFVIGTTGGEGFHNYHHTFPQDYKACCKSGDPRNVTALFIDLCAWLGMAYDLKDVPQTTVDIWVNKHGNEREHIEDHNFIARLKSAAITFCLLVIL